MSPAHVLEPTYRRLKRALMDGIWPGGTRLEALRLADEFGVSTTPVRDSLNQLVGEGLVDLTPGEGFRVPSLTEQGLRDLLETNALLLESVAGADPKVPDGSEEAFAGEEYADRIAAAFRSLAIGSDNRIVTYIVVRMGERLHPVRRHEPVILPAAWETLQQIEASLQAIPVERLRVLRRYHRLCQDHVSQLINSLSGQ